MKQANQISQEEQMHAQQADHWIRLYVVGGVHNAQKKKLKDKNSDQLKTLFVNQLIY